MFEVFVVENASLEYSWNGNENICVGLRISRLRHLILVSNLITVQSVFLV